MSIKIIRRGQEYFIVNKVEENHGIILEINCAKQIRKYNENYNNDCELYNDITTAINSKNNNQLEVAIEVFMRKYLKRRRAFTPTDIARFIMENKSEINNVLEVNKMNIDDIRNKFLSLRERFPSPLPPEVSFSKVLHFVRPESFWIVDSRVRTVLTMWGYSYKGQRGDSFSIFNAFGKFLKDLFNSDIFEGFKEFVTGNDNPGVPFLKTIDKILWWRKSISRE